MSTAGARHRTDERTGSTAELRNGLLVVNLYGSPYERGFAHGTLLKNEILSSRIVDYYSDLLRKLYNSSHFAATMPEALRRAVGDILEWWFYAPLEKLCLEETTQELYGIADAIGMDRKRALRGTMSPDVMEHLASSFLKGGKEALGNYYLGGCSAFYARGSAIRNNGPALFGRNMDFPGAFVWKHPALVFSHPKETVEVLRRRDDGEFVTESQVKAPYVYIASAGFPGHGLTGMTADGLAMGTFVCLSRAYGHTGMLTLDFNHYLLTRCDSAASVAERVRREGLVSVAPHTALFADADEAVAVEVDCEQAIPRRMSSTDESLPQTNHFVHPQLKQKEIEFPLEREHTIGRYRFIKDALQANYGKIDVAKAVDIIAGCSDRLTGEPRVIGDFPSQPITMTSVVMQPATKTMWVASGKPPAVCNSEYYGFDFSREISGTQSRLPSHSRSAQPAIPGFAPVQIGEDTRRSIRHLTLSQELLNMGKVRRALGELQTAIKLHDEPGYRYLRALVHLIAGGYREALEEIQTLRSSAQFAPVKAAALILWQARALDLLGRRAEAKETYRTLLSVSGIVPNLRQAGRKGMRRAYRKGDLPGTIDYAFLGPTTL